MKIQIKSKALLVAVTLLTFLPYILEGQRHMRGSRGSSDEGSGIMFVFAIIGFIGYGIFFLWATFSSGSDKDK